MAETSPKNGNYQVPLEDQASNGWDVAIVGAGPAGSLTARELAGKGYRVLLLDKYRFPRDKVCGDALIPDAIEVLRRTQLYERVRGSSYEVSLASVFSPSQIQVSVPGEFLTLRRSVLDSHLALGAVEAGAVFCEGNVTEIEPQGDGAVRLSVQGLGKAYEARIAVLATGAKVDLLGQLGILTRPEPSAVALRCYISSAIDLDRLIISYDRSVLPGYAWIFPLGNQEYNVGCGIFYQNSKQRRLNLHTMFDRFLNSFPQARELMRLKRRMTPVRGAPLRCNLTGAEVLGNGRVLAIGESIGATFPFTGEGIGKAMETGELAAQAIDRTLESGDFEPLCQLSERLKLDLLPRYRAYATAQKWLSQAWLNDLVAWRASKSVYLREAMAGIVAETSDAGDVFSLKGLWRSMWS